MHSETAEAPRLSVEVTRYKSVDWRRGETLVEMAPRVWIYGLKSTQAARTPLRLRDARTGSGVDSE
jgi:hypothetical protein